MRHTGLLTAAHGSERGSKRNGGEAGYTAWDPRAGIEPMSGHWQVDSYPLCHQGDPATFHWVNTRHVI